MAITPITTPPPGKVEPVSKGDTFAVGDLVYRKGFVECSGDWEPPSPVLRVAQMWRVTWPGDRTYYRLEATRLDDAELTDDERQHGRIFAIEGAERFFLSP